LIRHDNQQKSGILEPLQRFTGPRENDDLFRPMKVIFVFDQRAIPIQEHGAFH
jgi:hypothetical protein